MLLVPVTWQYVHTRTADSTGLKTQVKPYQLFVSANAHLVMQSCKNLVQGTVMFGTWHTVDECKDAQADWVAFASQSWVAT